MPNGKYFGGAPNAFAGGMEFQAAQRQRQFQDNALRALIQRFGPEAALPQAQAQLQTTQQEEQMHPYRMSAVQRQDAAHRENVRRFGTVAGSPDAHGIQQDYQQQQYTAALGAGRMLEHVLQQEGDIGSAIDRLTPFLTASGLLPPENIAELRSIMESNPDEAVPAFMAMLQGTQMGQTSGGVGGVRAISGGVDMEIDGKIVRAIPMSDGTTRYMEGTPVNPLHAAGRLDVSRDRLDWSQESHLLPSPQPGVQTFKMPDGRVVSDVVPGSPQERELMGEISEARFDARNMQRVNGGIIAAGRTVTRDGRRALARLGVELTPEPGEDLPEEMGALPMNVPLYRMLSSKVWGTSARRLERSIQSVMDNISIDKLLEIKATGAGLGHVPDRQLERLASVYGRLRDLDRPIPELIRDVEQVLWRYEEIMQYAQREIDEAEDFLSQPQGTSSGFGPQPRPSASYAPPPGIAAPPGQGTTGQAPPPSGPAQARAAELAQQFTQQGMARDQIRAAIEAQLRREGLIR